MNFKIQLLTLNNLDESNNTDNTAYYLVNTLSDFKDQLVEYTSTEPKKFVGSDWSSPAANSETGEPEDFYSYPTFQRNFSYTYEESISFHQNAQAEFSFKMDNFILRQTEWIENPYVNALTVGSQLAVTSLEETRIFTVKKIATSFSSNNCTYSYTCQDSFSYQLSRQNKGYTIENDSTSDDFIGAKTIDYWADKICTECYIPYHYVPLKSPLYIIKDLGVEEVTSSNIKNNVTQILKDGYSETIDTDYFETIIFSVSSSSANESLISLGEKYGMQLKVYEYFNKDVLKNLYYIKRYFWFIPIKDSDHLSGWSYNPTSNVSSFSLAQTAENLSTIVNVKSTESNDDLISLFPTLPPFFSKVYSSFYWKNSTYYDGYFSQLCKYYTQLFDSEDNNSELIEKTVLEKVTSKDDRLKDYSLFKLKRNFISSNVKERLKLYNRISYNNAQVNSYCYDGQHYYYSNLSGWLFAYQKDKDSEWIYYSNTDDINQDIWDKLLYYISTPDENIYKVDYKFAIAILGKTNSILSYKINFFFTREWTQEEEDYAAIADLCPWLENKLIDFKYLYEANIISRNQYIDLEDYFNNKLRIVNGQLALYSNEYYTAYHKKTTTLADLLSQIDSLAAMAEADLIQPYQDTGKIISSIDNFQLAYSLLWDGKKENTEKSSIIDYDKTITYYSKLYFNAQQRFLKNIYNFRKYFNENNSRFTDGTILAKLTFTADYEVDNGSYWLGLKSNNAGLYTLLSEATLLEENPVLYQYKDDAYNKVIAVDSNNVTNYLVFNDKNAGETQLEIVDNYVKDQDYWAYLWQKTEENHITLAKDDNGIPYLSKDANVDGYTSTRTVLKPIANYDLDNPQMGDLYVMRCLKRDGVDTIYQRDEDTYTKIKGNWPDTANKKWSEGVSKISYTNYEFSGDNYHFYFGNSPDSVVIAQTPFSERTLMKPYISLEEDDSLALRELYAKYFPIQSYYYLETNDKGKDSYKQISLVTYQNESSYYRHVTTGEETGRALNITGTALSLMSPLGFAIGIGLWIASACIRSSGYNTEIWNTEGNSQAPIDFSYRTWSDKIASGWSNNFYFPWYLKDKDDKNNLLNLANNYGKDPSKNLLEYSTFFNLLGLTYSCLALPVTKTNDEEDLPSYKEAPITAAVANNLDKFYYKESYATIKVGNNYCNSSDTYYIVPLMTFYDNGGTFDKDTISNYYNTIKGSARKESDDKFYAGVLNRPSGSWDVDRGNIQGYFCKSSTDTSPKEISTVVNYPLFDNSVTMNFSGKDELNENGKTTLFEALSKKISNLSTDGIFWYSTEQLKDSNGDYLYAHYKPGKNWTYDEIYWDTKTTNGKQYVHTLFLVFHKQPYKIHSILNKEDSYSPLTGKPFYFKDDDFKIDFSSAQGIVEGLYTEASVASDEVLQQATKEDLEKEGTIFFNKNKERAYTLEQYKDKASALQIYIRNLNKYSTNVILTPNQPTSLSLPIIYNYIKDTTTNTVVTNGEATYDIQLYYDSFEKKISFYYNDCPISTFNVNESYEGNYYKTTFKINPDAQTTVDLGELTNGELWYKYHGSTNNEYESLLEYAAVIETQLQTYWESAYGASKGCDYFLPQYWQPTIVNDINFFSQQIIQNQGTAEEPDLTLLSTYIPNVSIVEIGHNTLLPDYNWVYQTSIEPQILTETQKSIIDYANLTNDTEKAISENGAISEFLTSLSTLLNDNSPTQHWVLQPLNGVTKTYYTVTSGGCTWSNLVSNITGNAYRAESFNGTYPMLLKKWSQRYNIDEMLNYNRLLKNHNDIWKEIYLNYPNIILEEVYSDSDAISSNDLLKGARNYLRQYYQPENNYSVSVINRSDLEGPGYVPKIGQGILIDPTYYVKRSSKNFTSAIQQYLFVTDISYTLRSNSDIRLTVNSIKYSDKLIQRMAKLIK